MGLIQERYKTTLQGHLLPSSTGPWWSSGFWWCGPRCSVPHSPHVASFLPVGLLGQARLSGEQFELVWRAGLTCNEAMNESCRIRSTPLVWLHVAAVCWKDVQSI